MVRWYGFSKGLSAYLVTRFKQADSGVWMPELWIDTECRQEDLSEEFRLATKPHRLNFEQLGFASSRLFEINPAPESFPP